MEIPTVPKAGGLVREDITYYVPTMGRTDQIPVTLNQLKLASLLDKTVIFCPQKEVNFWLQEFPKVRKVVSQPLSVNGIGQVRAHMLRDCGTRYFFMIDDDIKFANRYPDGRLEAIRPSSQEYRERFRFYLYDHVLSTFARYDTVGIGHRMFCQDREDEVENKQTGWAWGYDLERVMPDLAPALDRLTLHEDTDWCLTLLESGHKNVIQSYIVSQGRRVSLDPTDGGCAVYRTPELVKEQTEKFIALHPNTVTPREPREGLAETTQYRHTVHWKRAYRPKETQR